MRSIVKCKQRMITLIILILAIILCVCSIVFTTEQEVALAEENYFTGHSSLSFANKKESISYQTAGGAPVLTLLIHGISEGEEAWSGDIINSFSYSELSLINHLMSLNDSIDIYLVKIQSNNQFNLKKLDINDYNSQYNLSMLENNSGHSIIVLNYEDSNYNNFNELYYSLEKVIVELLNEYIYFGTQKPTVNLIGHGVGGLLNIEFANNYPNTVNSIFNIGTPHHGSDTISFLRAMGMDEGNNVLSNVLNSPALDVLNSSKLQSLLNTWNNETIVKNPDIEAHAISGVMTKGYIVTLAHVLDKVRRAFSDDGMMIDMVEGLIEDSEALKNKLGDRVELLLGILRKSQGKTSLYELYDSFGVKEKYVLTEYIKEAAGIDIEPSTLELLLSSVKSLHDEYLNDDEYTSFSTYIQNKMSLLAPYIDAYGQIETALGEINIFGKAKSGNTTQTNSTPLIYVLLDKLSISQDMQHMFENTEVLGDISVAQLLQYLRYSGYAMEFAPWVNFIAPNITEYVIQLISKKYLSSLTALQKQELGDFLDDIVRRDSTDISVGRRGLIFDDLIFASDFVVQYDSQKAAQYNAFQRFCKQFHAEDVVLSNVSNLTLPIPVPHFLQTKDEEIISYIADNIEIGTPSTMYRFLKTEGGYEVKGFNSLYDSQETVYLPATYKNEPVIGIGKNAFKQIGASALPANINFVLPDSIQYISAFAFSDIGNMTINFPSSLKRIESYAFAGSDPGTVTLPAGIEYIASNAFYDSQVQFAQMSGDVYEVSSDGIIYDTYTLSTGQVGKRVVVAYASNVVNFVAGNSVLAIGAYAFAGAQGLKSIDLNNVVSIGEYAFAYSGLGSVSGGNVIADIGTGAFDGVELNNNTSSNGFLIVGKTLIRYFGASARLNREDFPSGIETVYSNAFADSNVEFIDLPETVKYIESRAFAGAPKLKEVIFPGLIRYIGEAAFSGNSMDSIMFLGASAPDVDMNMLSGVVNTDVTLNVPISDKSVYLGSDFFAEESNRIGHKQINITFDTNGGSSVDSLQVSYYSVLGDLPVPTRPYYVFTGWEDEDHNLYEKDYFLDKYQDTTFYARWQLRNYGAAYSVEMGIHDNPTVYTAEDDLTLSDVSAVPTGYTFGGWYYNNERIYYLPLVENEIPVLVAHFLPNVYSVILDDGIDITTVSVTYGAAYDFYVPVVEGYVFLGWEYTVNGNSTLLTNENGQSFGNWTYTTDNLVLYARMTEKEFAISVTYYESNGGAVVKWLKVVDSIPSFVDNEYFVKYGTMIDGEKFFELVRQTGIAYKEGHILSDIDIKSNNSGGPQNAPGPGPKMLMIPDLGVSGSSVSMVVEDESSAQPVQAKASRAMALQSVNMLLEPIYIKEYYKIGLSVEGTVSYKYLDYGEQCDFGAYTKVGHTMTGWTTDAGDDFDYYYIPDLTPGVEGNLLQEYMLYANFEINEYTIRYYVDGNLYASQQYFYNDNVSMLEIPQKEGYNFVHWDPYVYVMPASDVRVDAVFEKAFFTVVFKSDGYVYEEITVANGAKATAPVEPPEKYGYTFTGWDTDLNTPVKNDMTINALFGRYTVSQNDIVNGQLVIAKKNDLDTAILNNSIFNSSPNSAVDIIIKNNIKFLTIDGGNSVSQLKNKRIVIETGDTELKLVVKNVSYEVQTEAAISINRSVEIISTGQRNQFSCVYNGAIMSGAGITASRNAVVTISGSAKITFIGGNGSEEYGLGGVGIYAFNCTINGQDVVVQGGRGIDGIRGADGSKGAAGTNATSAGATGGTGGSGTNGGFGTNGADGGAAIWTTNLTINNGAKLTLIAGDGGNGGAGGNGGNGGQGGRGGDGKLLVKVGTGGRGGNGGNGGKGGTGGNAGTYIFNVMGTLNVVNNGTIAYVPGKGGAGGAGGAGGTGGAGGLGGTKWTGSGRGPSGSRGNNGSPGATGSQGSATS